MYKNVGSVIEWLKRRDCDQHGFASKPTRAFFSVLGKVTSLNFLLLGGPGNQF